MSQIDFNLISRIVRDNDLRTVWSKGISVDLINGVSEKEIFLYVEDHYRKYSAVPSSSIISQRFGIDIAETQESLEYWADEVVNRALYVQLVDSSEDINRLMQERKPQLALEKMREIVNKASKRVSSGKVTIENLFSLTEVIKQKYQEAKEGKMGIPTPWLSMNECTMGWMPEDISFFVARPGVGKTWVASLLAVAAWQSGKKVRLLSCEMAKEDVSMRILSIIMKIQYGAIRKGRLGLAEGEFFAELDALKGKSGIDIVDCKQGMTSMDVDNAVAAGDTDLVIIDAAYRIKSGVKTRDRFENMAIVVDDAKGSAQRHRMPIVLTTQLNRASTKNKEGGLEDIALSDVIGWNATNVFQLSQNKEQYESRIMEFKKLKTRESENSGKPIAINWDMVTMNFDEIQEAKVQMLHRKDWNDDDF